MAKKTIKKTPKKRGKKTPKKEPKKTGRPTSYKKEYADLAYKFCLLGATDERLAENFGVCEKTISNWKHDHPEFLQAVYNGKDVADAEVAHSFHKRAKGYSYEEVTKGVKNGKETIVKKVTKEVPPDAGAALNWLKNRKPKLWRDKQEHEHTGKDGKELPPAQINLNVNTPKELL